jgi:hypothetical protein
MIRTKLSLPEKTVVRFLKSLFEDLGDDVRIHSASKGWTSDGIQFEVDHTIQPPVDHRPILLTMQEEPKQDDNPRET